MRIDGKKISGGKKTYMWIYRNRPRKKSLPVVLFDWQPSRRADHPREFLKDFSGTVVTGGYQVYHTLGNEREDLNIAGCWIHARRSFAEFIKSIGEETAKANQLNTYKYFELILTEIPKHTVDTDLRFLDDLMPWSDRVQR